jgi:hypothetical protein
MDRPDLTRGARSSRRRALVGIAIIAALVLPAGVAADTARWTRQFGTDKGDYAGGIVLDASGISIGGETYGSLGGPSLGYSDGFVRRYDRMGHHLWTDQFGTPTQERVNAITQDWQGLTIAGQTDGALARPHEVEIGTYDIFVRRYARSGDVLWTRQFGTNEEDEAHGIAADSEGVTVVGETWGSIARDNPSDWPDAVVRHYGRAGTVDWTRQFGTAAPDVARAVAVSGSAIFVLGSTSPRDGGGGSWIRRYDPSGRLLWHRSVPCGGRSIAADEGLAVVGGFDDGERSVYALCRYDRAGRLLWTRQFGAYEDGVYPSAVATDRDSIVVTGYINQGKHDIFVRRYAKDGALLWRSQFGTPEPDIGSAVDADGDGFALLAHTDGSLTARGSAGETDVVVRWYDR